MTVIKMTRHDRGRDALLGTAKQSARARGNIVRPFAPVSRPGGETMIAGFFMGGSLDGVQRPVPHGFDTIDVECRKPRTLLLPGQPPFDVINEVYKVFLLEPPGAPSPMALCVLEEVGFVAAIKNLMLVYMIAVGTVQPTGPPEIVT